MPDRTQAQADLAADLESRIEMAFSKPTTLGLIHAEILGADLSDSDRQDLLGRIAQYGIDFAKSAEGQSEMEGTDGRAGGSAN